MAGTASKAQKILGNAQTLNRCFAKLPAITDQLINRREQRHAACHRAHHALTVEGVEDFTQLAAISDRDVGFGQGCLDVRLADRAIFLIGIADLLQRFGDVGGLGVAHNTFLNKFLEGRLQEAGHVHQKTFEFCLEQAEQVLGRQRIVLVTNFRRVSDQIIEVAGQAIGLDGLSGLAGTLWIHQRQRGQRVAQILLRFLTKPLIFQVLEVKHVIGVGGQVEQLLFDCILVGHLVQRIGHFALVVLLHRGVGKQGGQLLLQLAAINDVVHVGRTELGLFAVELAPGATECTLCLFIAGQAAPVVVGSLCFYGADQFGARVVLGDFTLFHTFTVLIEQFLGRQFTDVELFGLFVILVGLHAGFLTHQIHIAHGRQVVLAAGLTDIAGAQLVPFFHDVIVQLRACILGHDELSVTVFKADKP